MLSKVTEAIGQQCARKEAADAERKAAVMRDRRKPARRAVFREMDPDRNEEELGDGVERDQDLLQVVAAEYVVHDERHHHADASRSERLDPVHNEE